jgi:hypothetical protein
MKKLIIIILSGILLIPILLGAMTIKKVRLYFWNYFNRYYNLTLPLNKTDQIFGLCVNYLMMIGEKTNMTYNEVNVYIFCLIWPIITLVALIL